MDCSRFECDLTDIYIDIFPPCDNPDIDCHDQYYVCKKYCKYFSCEFCHKHKTGECPCHD